MIDNESIIRELDELINLGDEVLHTKRVNSASGRYVVEQQLSTQWGTRSLSFIERILGRDSIYFEKLIHESKAFNEYYPVLRGVGILRALKDDIANSGLTRIVGLVRADVFDDLLEQAEYLLENGFHTAAAVISGAVLENGLRELCTKYGIPLSDRPKLDSMNSALAKSKVYNSFVQKKITAIADIRNSAAHGKESEYNKEDVVDMVKHIRRLIEEWV